MCWRDLRLPSVVPSVDALERLSGGNIGTYGLLLKLMDDSRIDPILLLGALDTKHLYDEKAYYLFKYVCGSDVDRFLYHLDMELPCQLCGQMSYTGPHYADMSREEQEAHMAARRFWKPGSYWALKDPPENPDYEYPIRTELPALS